ncbi:hypothetical protein JQN58_23405 [Aneurinibacillus sp. BA2021]|nr:hypothetical protein [Aneurinibacillus sp. BA2021]
MADHHPDALPDGTAITLGWESVHELTTEHGTRIVVHPGRGWLAWMRLPASHADGVVNADPRDGRRQRLHAIWPEGTIVDNGPPIVPDTLIRTRSAQVLLAWSAAC